ncbi:MAG: hypothetical protein HQK49_22075 [Oligoflexia bacterium]|nr:hypothetical protein [Oligoflexia bacterium]
MKVLISEKEHYALIDIRDVPDCVHHMVYGANHIKDKYVLEGEKDSFDELLSLISEEIGEGLCPKKNIPTLLSICKKVNPESLDWIGM